EIETVIQRHPDIIEVAVIGEADEKWREIPKAYIVTKEDSDLTAAASIELCKKNLASYKTGKKVEFIDVLPRNEAVNVLKRKIKKIAENESTFKPYTDDMQGVA